MSQPIFRGAPDDVATLQRRLERERASRLEAEAIAERGLRDLYEREQQLGLIARIASAANQTQSVEDVLRFVLTQICVFTGWPVGHAYMTDSSAGTVRLRSMGIWYAAAPEGIASFRRATEAIDFGPSLGLPSRVYVERGPHWLCDLTKDDGFCRPRAAEACGLKAACAFPVMIGDEVAAVLEFFIDKPLERDEALVALMSQAGMQLGRVIERKRAQDRLIHDASHDVLTGLPNRALFLDRLNRAIARHKVDPEAAFAVLFIDLDRFKVVNDSLGHLAGDDLIVQVAARLRASLRRADLVAPPELGRGEDRETLARLGGDEFTILLTDIRDPADAVRVANRVQEALRQPFSVGGQEIYTTSSIGIASSATGYSCADDILRDADLAMYRAKAQGKARSELYDRDMHAAAMKRLKLESDLRRALANNEFVLHYQPIVSLGTQDIVGFEALVRWQKPDGDLVFPGEFIDVAEDTGLIVFLGMWVLREACSAARRWHETFEREEPLTVSVNLSPRQFHQPDLVPRVRQIIAETGIDARTLRLEITESVTSGDSERIVRILSQLKEIGIRLSIDDFGTGYSSLSYLHQFPLDVLKIDRSFVSRMEKSDQSLQIVRTIMNLARNLGMSVIAEGTELEAQVSQLKSLGCDFGQGYFFSKPVDAAAVQGLLRGPSHWVSAAGSTGSAGGRQEDPLPEPGTILPAARAGSAERVDAPPLSSATRGAA